MELLKFQKEFIRNALREDISIAGLCLPRGNGKSTLAGWLAARILNPDDDMFRSGSESVLVAGSIEQARIVFRVTRGFLGEDGYRYLDSNTRIGITETRTNTKLRIIGSNGRTAMGLLDCPWAICDEPGSWETLAGELVWTALTTARGKPESPLKILICGTLAPKATGPGHWWWDMVYDGSKGSTYIMALKGDPAKWNYWPEIKRVNPLMARYPDSRKELLAERDEARNDSRKRASFLSYHCNVPTGDEATLLLTVDDWERTLARKVPSREGRPIVALDMGGGRAWSAACCIYTNGRIEAVAVCPGIPSIADQEKRDRVGRNTYQRLVDSGKLEIAEGLRVPLAAQLLDRVRSEWGNPTKVISDRFRMDELLDSRQGLKLAPRVSRWSEASADIRALRKGCKDGPFSVDHDSRLLITASLSAAMVENDKAGNTQMIKKSSNNTARDDVAFALHLAAGGWDRDMNKPKKVITSSVVR